MAPTRDGNAMLHLGYLLLLFSERKEEKIFPIDFHSMSYLLSGRKRIQNKSRGT